ncbi:hypothetical protein LDENG_00147260 [Lucifuga dentata]|nr:hypothetical protein LDENG_00147260 [Lucifuga dentata]
MLSSVRRHSLRLQTELHRWSICDTGSHLLPDGFLTRVPACIARSKSCNSSAGESDGSRGSWSSSDSVISIDSAEDSTRPGNRYRVVLLGARGVGKTAFASIFAGAADSMDSDDCELCGDEVCEKSVEVDGESATVTVFDTWDAEADSECAMQTGDAYLLLYSITDRASFLRASELRITLRRHRPAQHTPIILVGNKCDLVRGREVSVSEGRTCAAVFDCKFIETSAAMQHNVWEAFHGIVRQLRLRRDSKEANKRRSLRSDSLDLSSKTVIMTAVVHLLLLPLLLSIVGGRGLEDKKGSLENKVLDVPEATTVPYPIYQFVAATPGVNSFRLKGEGSDAIMISDDGWLYLEKPLDWAQNSNYMIAVEALVDDEVVEGPVFVTINVLDINNHAPSFNQSDYVAVVRENSPAGVPFVRVFASDQDDPTSPNAHLRYSLVTQIPNRQNILFFQINPVTGEISTTEEGAQMLKAREGIQYSRGEGDSTDALKRKFNEFCSPTKDIPYEHNPFYTCVERAEMRRRNINPLEDPDYTLIVRVQDLGGASENALSGTARVDIVVQQNLWINPGPITVEEQLDTHYPFVIAKVRSNDPSASYRLVQKERELRFPFSITEDGVIELLEKLDREEKDMYILVVLAEDNHGNNVDPPMEIQVLVEDVNDNLPVCEKEESVFEVQENEPVGSPIGQVIAHDEDEAGTVNALLTYTILSQNPSINAFSIDDASGQIQALRSLQRKDATEYQLTVKVSDPGFSTECKVLIKVIDINNELPLFEKSDYGNHTLAEDTPVGQTVLTIKASDADDPGSGSSLIEFHISSGNDDDMFAIETDGSGVGKLVVAKPLDFESSSSYKLKIDARNPEPLMVGLEYGSDSSAFVTVSVTDVDEAPEFSLYILDVTVPENITKGATVLTVEAKDPEGKEISFKMEGDANGWLEIDAATGEIKTKAKLDRETLEAFEVTVTAFEKDNPEMSAERVVSVQLLDVNDNFPMLTETQAFICVRKPEPVIIQAQDADSTPLSQPFTFTFAHGKKSPNWELQPVDGTSAKLTLKKSPTEDKTFTLPINIKDSAGMGITHKFEVRVCNCTELGYCYMAPDEHGFKFGMGATIGILAGVLGFCVVVFLIVLNRIKKDDKKKAMGAEEDKNAML